MHHDVLAAGVGVQRTDSGALQGTGDRLADLGFGESECGRCLPVHVHGDRRQLGRQVGGHVRSAVDALHCLQDLRRGLVDSVTVRSGDDHLQPAHEARGHTSGHGQGSGTLQLVQLGTQLFLDGRSIGVELQRDRERGGTTAAEERHRTVPGPTGDLVGLHPGQIGEHLLHLGGRLVRGGERGAGRQLLAHAQRVLTSLTDEVGLELGGHPGGAGHHHHGRHDRYPGAGQRTAQHPQVGPLQ